MPRETPRYLAVYGAMVAAQVQEHLAHGIGEPTREDMRRFVLEAHAVASYSEQVQGEES